MYKGAVRFYVQCRGKPHANVIHEAGPELEERRPKPVCGQGRGGNQVLVQSG